MKTTKFFIYIQLSKKFLKKFRASILLLHDLKASENVTNFRDKNVISVDTERVKELFN
jgi:hypothetical protein